MGRVSLDHARITGLWPVFETKRVERKRERDDRSRGV